MRLWHEDMINLLPRQQLLGQHRECAALRGNGWNKKHETVNYVFEYNPYKLFQYHILIINEMLNRGYKPDNLWLDPYYRGKSCEKYNEIDIIEQTKPIYKEHDDNYYTECVENLKEKGIIIKVDK